MGVVRTISRPRDMDRRLCRSVNKDHRPNPFALPHDLRSHFVWNDEGCSVLAFEELIGVAIADEALGLGIHP